MPGKPFTAVGADISFSFEIGWPNTGTGFKLDLKAKIKALDQTFDLVSIEGNLRPEDLDTLEKLAAAVIKQFFSDFPNLLKNVLGGLGIKDIGNFVSNFFGVTGSSLVTAVSALGSSDAANVMVGLGRDFLGFSSYNDSMKMLTGFGYDVGPSMATTARVFGVSVDDIPVWKPGGEEPWRPSPGNDPWKAVGDPPWTPGGTPWKPGGDPVWQPGSGGVPWKPGGEPWTAGGGGGNPWGVGGNPFGGENSLSGFSSPIFSSLAVNTVVPEKEQVPTTRAAQLLPANNGGSTSSDNNQNVLSPLKRESKRAANQKVIENPAASRDEEVVVASVPKEVEASNDTRAHSPPMKEHVDMYFKAQRLALIYTALQYFPLEEVEAASQEVFSDLSREEVQEYMEVITG